MAESVTVTNFPNSGTPHAVALEIWKNIRIAHGDVANSVEAELLLYRRCLNAVYGKADINR